MLNLDRIIEESNKEIIYGKKPELPEKLEEGYIYADNGACRGKSEPTIKEIRETINKIIDYLEWQDK